MKKLTFGLVVLALGLTPILNAETDAETKALRSIRNVPAPELAARAAYLVRSAAAAERTSVGIALAKSIAARHQTVLKATVAAIAAVAPESAPAVAAAAATVAPRQAGLLAVAASHAAPGEAHNIAAEVARVTPGSAVVIANSVAKILPQSEARIVTAVAAAVPSAAFSDRQLTSTRSATHIPGHVTVSTKPGFINPVNIGKPLPGANTNVILQGDPDRYAAP